MSPSPALDAGSLVTVSLLANGSAVADSVQILSISVTKAVNRIATARIVLLDGDMPNQDFPVSSSADFAPGVEVEIKAGYDTEEESIFKGIVIRHGIRITGDNDARLVIDCQDKAVKMTLGRRNANYLKQKDSDIISTLVGSYGLTATVTATDVTYPEMSQYYCTDWDFMVSRAEINGFIVLAEDGTVTVRAPIPEGAAPVLTVTYGDDLMEFHGEIDARTQYKSVKGASWDPGQQAVTVVTSSPQTLNAQGDLTSSTLADVGGLAEFRLQSGIALDRGALQKWTDAQQVKSGLGRIQGRLKFIGSAKAKIGSLITLVGLGGRFNGDAFVSAVRHDIARGHWITEAEFGLAPDWAADRRNFASPPAAGLIPPVEGLQVGVVTKLDEDPEAQYRVRVSVPVTEAETADVWARLSRWYASEGIGAFFVPEIGDEVVLGFFNNDPSHAVILGSMYSKKRTPFYTPTAENFTKALVTKSKLKVEFDDDKKVITIVTPANNKVVLSDEDKSILLTDQNSNVVKLNPDGILIDSPGDIKINAKGKITVTAVGEISISSSGGDIKASALNINNDAKVGFVAKGAATAELSASGQTTVKGALVMIN
jgi:Rhs element Vgr protein